jgi:hypothetical protein
MTYENKPPLFGPSAVFDPATYVPRSGKSFWMAATAMARMNIEFGTFLFGDDDNSGEDDDDFGYSFTVVDASPGPSFFDAPAGQE